MKAFDYTVKDELGIHARPAGLIAKMAKTYTDTVVTVTKKDKSVKASQLMKLMGLAVKKGDTVTVTVEGAKEEEAIVAFEEFFKANL